MEVIIDVIATPDRAHAVSIAKDDPTYVAIVAIFAEDAERLPHAAAVDAAKRLLAAQVAAGVGATSE